MNFLKGTEKQYWLLIFSSPQEKIYSVIFEILPAKKNIRALPFAVQQMVIIYHEIFKKI